MLRFYPRELKCKVNIVTFTGESTLNKTQIKRCGQAAAVTVKSRWWTPEISTILLQRWLPASIQRRRFTFTGESEITAGKPKTLAESKMESKDAVEKMKNKTITEAQKHADWLRQGTPFKPGDKLPNLPAFVAEHLPKQIRSCVQNPDTTAIKRISKP